MENWGESIALEEQIDSWQQELVSWESEIARIRARQVELIRHLDRYQVDTAEGARTMGDWASAHLDVSRQTATRLTQLAHHSDPEIEQAMAEGRWGLDRAAALTKLRQAGISLDLKTLRRNHHDHIAESSAIALQIGPSTEPWPGGTVLLRR